MQVEIVAVFIPIVFIIAVAFLIIYLRRYENEERMSMIEKGMDPASMKKIGRGPSIALRFALLLVGAGTGLLFGYLLDSSTNMQEVAYFSMIFIFGGLGLGASYLIQERKEKEA